MPPALFLPHYSYRTLHQARTTISDAERKLISGYTRRDIGAMLSRDMSDNRMYWRTLTEAVEVLFHHPNQIVRHEAAFVLAGAPYRHEVERSFAIRSLRYAMRFDRSIVVRHESAEALGEVYGAASVGAVADLAKILAFPEEHHADVVKTAEESFEHICDYLRKEGQKDTVTTLRRWSKGKFG